MKEQMTTSKQAGAEPVKRNVTAEEDVVLRSAILSSSEIVARGRLATPPAVMPEKPYRGDPPQPTRLTTKESSRKASIAALRANIEKLQSNLNVHIAACDHAAFVDEPGFPYHSRMCAVCNAHIAFI